MTIWSTNEDFDIMIWICHDLQNADFDLIISWSVHDLSSTQDTGIMISLFYYSMHTFVLIRNVWYCKHDMQIMSWTVIIMFTTLLCVLPLCLYSVCILELVPMQQNIAIWLVWSHGDRPPWSRSPWDHKDQSPWVWPHRDGPPRPRSPWAWSPWRSSPWRSSSQRTISMPINKIIHCYYFHLLYLNTWSFLLFIFCSSSFHTK